MKDIKIQTVRPALDSHAPGKNTGKGKTPETSFNDTLKTTIARMNDLKTQADGALKRTETSIKQEIDTAQEIYDKMMLEKKNLSQLYHRIKTQEET